ncbi:MAG TPA: sulfite exporter TauE/SafE family protein [Dongiaceae bacterium]|jgi:hypothetical protein|nr:sulfite exporter TauE/SafE family protein [Dongiaceae bacterium]
MSHGIDLLYVLSGFCVGALVGMTGVGGGSLMTPLLILLFGVHPSAAVGTDLLYAAITKTGGIAVHSIHRTIDWRVVGRLAAGSVPAAALTILALSRVDLYSGGVRTLINDVLGAALLLTALVLIFRQRILAAYASRVGRLRGRTTLILTIGFGALLGVLVSISSVGAGAIGVTALLLLYPDLPMRRVVGSDIAHAVPLTLVGGIGHAILGSTNWPILLSLLVGSIPGVLLGGQLSVKVPDAVLRFALATILIVVVGRLVL